MIVLYITNILHFRERRFDLINVSFKIAITNSVAFAYCIC